ncbi:MAG: peptidase M23 [Flavobacteriales bacterium]|nr:peptidase M23 [Flavobacteriales bacterium]|tara:strand:+ start:8085 stop:9047 length:963 start_codon:yes stop_codon:yes gene_type:complete
MIKTKYYYDKETLSYKKVKNSKFGFLKNLLILFMPVLIMSTGFSFVILSFFKTPNEILLQKEINQLTAEFKKIENKIISTEKTLNELSEKDAKIYRIMLDASPISDDVRLAGFGGVDKYSNLEKLHSTEMIIDISKKTDQLIKKLGIQSKSLDELFSLAIEHSEKIQCIPAIEPLSKKDYSRISSGFGPRIDPHYKIRKMHTGTDFAAPTGTPVYATGNGKIIEAVNRSRGGYGKFIVIDHGYGYKTQYAHLSKLAVNTGQNVKRGELIGYVGNTGKSTSPHLHYEVRINNKKVNPIDYFYNDLTIEEYDQMRKNYSQKN